MPKPKQKPTTKSKPSHSQNTRLKTYYKTHPRKTILLLAVAILALVLGIKTVVTQIQIHHERNQFIQAKTDLDTIYTGLIANIGKPDAHRAEQSCHYSSAKFEKGFLTCTTRLTFSYLDRSLEESLMTKTIINQYLKNNYSANDYPIGTYGSEQKLPGVKIMLRGLRCGVDYEYVGDEKNNRLQPAIKQRGLYVELYCHDYAMDEYFTVVEQSWR